MNFGTALSNIKDGWLASRRGWNGVGQYVALHLPERTGNAPYLELHNTQGLMVSWLPSQGDLLADDWFVFTETAEA